MADVLEAAAVRALAAECGISAATAVSVHRLAARLDAVDWWRKPRAGTSVLLPALAAHLPDPLAGSFIACAFPYPGGAPADGNVSVPPAAAGRRATGAVAAFARAHYYRIGVKALQKAAGILGRRHRLPKSVFRIFVNSRIPEKLVAYGAGLGRYGRNRLLFHDRFGSRFVIGLLFAPFALTGEGDDPRLIGPDDFCGACAACLAACPADALRSGTDDALSRCLKARADALDVWDESTRRAWGTRFYGCDTCQDVCPKNPGPAADAFAMDGSSAGEGCIGAEVDLARLLAIDAGRLRERFRRTALDFSWIKPEALLRNALCAAGNSGAMELLEAVRRHRASPEPAVADMADWAARRLAPGGTGD